MKEELIDKILDIVECNLIGKIDQDTIRLELREILSFDSLPNGEASNVNENEQQRSICGIKSRCAFILSDNTCTKNGWCEFREQI